MFFILPLLFCSFAVTVRSPLPRSLNHLTICIALYLYLQSFILISIDKYCLFNVQRGAESTDGLDFGLAWIGWDWRDLLGLDWWRFSYMYKYRTQK